MTGPRTLGSLWVDQAGRVFVAGHLGGEYGRGLVFICIRPVDPRKPIILPEWYPAVDELVALDKVTRRSYDPAPPTDLERREGIVSLTAEQPPAPPWSVPMTRTGREVDDGPTVVQSIPWPPRATTGGGLT